MKTVPYEQVKQQAAELADRTRDNLPANEALMLRAFFATHLPDLWNREAWPELCDHLEAVTLDAANTFSAREGNPTTEMGDILALITGGDPRVTAAVTILPRDQSTRLDGRVHVLADVGGGLWVDWQTPAPDLLSEDLDDEAALNAYELPARFKLPLALKGAAELLATEDPLRAAQYRVLADTDLLKQAARLTKPWWRR